MGDRGKSQPFKVTQGTAEKISEPLITKFLQQFTTVACRCPRAKGSTGQFSSVCRQPLKVGIW